MFLLPFSFLKHLPGKDSATATRKGVGMLLPEHVPHSATGNDFQAATTLPHSKGDLCDDGDKSDQPRLEVGGCFD